MKIIAGSEFDEYWKKNFTRGKNETSDFSAENTVENSVKEIIEAVRNNGDSAVRHYASLYDRSSPETLEVPPEKIRRAVNQLETETPELAKALRFAAENIKRFALKQREQFSDFEFENVPGVFTGQKIIPVNRAGVYVPGGRYPLISSALMCLIPAFCAGVGEVCFASPPSDDGFPDKRILATAGIAAETCGCLDERFRSFSMGGAQAIAALALGTQTIPRCDMIAGPGNKYVAAAKRILFGETGIDFIAGPSDILVITDENFAANLSAADLAAVDMLAQAEHDPDARARALVPNAAAAEALSETLRTHLQKSSGNSAEKTNEIARQSLEAGGLIIIYDSMNEAQKIANAVAPEHLELHVKNPEAWIPALKNFGSLFIGQLSAEVLGDYSGGLNHTLPTSGSARFTGGLCVRNFLKTVTTLRCEKKSGYAAALDAAEKIALAEGLAGHAKSAKIGFRADTPVIKPVFSCR